MRNINAELARLSPTPYNAMNIGDVAFLASLNVGITTSEFYNQTTDNADIQIMASGGNGSRAGLQILAGSVAIGEYFQFIKFKLNRFGTTPGNYQIALRDSGDSEKFSKDFAVSGIGTTKAVIEHDLGELVGPIAEGDRILYEYTGGSGGNGTKIYGDSTAGVSGFAETLYNYSPAYVNDANDAVVGIVDSNPT